MHALSLPLSPLHTYAPVRPLLCIFFPPFPHSLPPRGVVRTQTPPHRGAMLHITIYDRKTPVDRLCMCVRAPQPGAYTSGRRGLKDEREIMKCVFWPPQGGEEDSRRHRLDSDLVYIKVSFYKGSYWSPYYYLRALSLYSHINELKGHSNKHGISISLMRHDTLMIWVDTCVQQII